jgi:predicted AAA+ superfamily ATPase
MNRFRLNDCITWLKNPRRKPLIIRGARQVGKTWLVRELARSQKRRLVELNLEKRPDLSELFNSNNPSQICELIEAELAVNINQDSSLLFLDEIQACPELIAKLRWFYEEMPQLPVVAAGSLLDFALAEHSFSMPVGRVSYLHLEPMTFFEWLEACEENALLKNIKKCRLDKWMPELLHEKTKTLLRDYLLTGGLPAVVADWASKRNLQSCMNIQHDLIATYRDDFNKYSKHMSPSLLDSTFASIARQLGTKFTYNQVDPEKRSSSVKKALHLLCQARLATQVKHSASNGIPLAAEDNVQRFKVIMLDCGLVSALLQLGRLPPQALSLMQVNRGALMEQFIGQQFRSINESFREPVLFYWQREHGRRGEIDYVIQHGPRVIPVEIKAGPAGKMKSLQQFMVDKKLEYAIRFYDGVPSLQQISQKSTKGDRVEYRLLSLPHYAAELLPEFLDTTG